MFSFKNKYFQYAVILFLAMIWGSSFILIKKSLVSFKSDEMAALRIMLSGLFLIPMIAKQIPKVEKKHIGFLLLSGLFGNAIPAFLWAYAQQGLDSSFAGLINSTTPIFTMILGFLFFGIKFKPITLLGIIIGLSGAVFLLYSYHGLKEGPAFYFSALALGGAFCYAVSLNVIKSRLSELPSLIITGFPFILTSTLSVIFLLYKGTFPKIAESEASSLAFFYIVLLAVFATSIGVYVFNLLIKATSAVFASMVTYLIPAFSIIWGILDGESTGLFYFVGLAIILSGIWLVNRGK